MSLEKRMASDSQKEKGMASDSQNLFIIKCVKRLITRSLFHEFHYLHLSFHKNTNSLG